MKKIITLLFIIISMYSYSQIQLAPDNKILQNIKTVSISDDKKFESLPEITIKDTIIQKPGGDDGTRVVYFIHGLGGSEASWLRAGVACSNRDANTNGFRARNVESSIIDYSNYTETDMNAPLIALINHIRNNTLNSRPEYNPDRSKNFIIAHSQGGVVARSLLRNDTYLNNPSAQTRGYGGLVTVASPLQGARILNNVAQITDMANDGCTNLAKGPTSTFVAQTIFSILGRDIPSSICNIATSKILPYLFKGALDSITRSYYVGAPWIDSLNYSCNTPQYKQIPKVAFYGVEPNENIFWRTLNWFRHSPNGPSYWEANDDYMFYNLEIHPRILQYNGNYVAYKNSKTNLENNWGWYFSGGIVGVATYFTLLQSYNNKIDAWGSGVEWFNRANDRWLATIGGVEYVEDQTQSLYLCYNLFNTPRFQYVTNSAFCLPPNIILYKQAIYKPIYKESDGVVLAESAYNLPDATHAPIRLRGIMQSGGSFTGSSHMQIRNDGALKESLNQLFNGEYGMYFKTVEK